MIHSLCDGAFEVSTDKARLDITVIHPFLHGSYWAEGIPRDIVQRSILNSLCFGAYKGNEQIGFARVITDHATYAYLSDVFVLEEYRGQGIGKLIMRCIMSHPDLQGLRRWGLLTRDAHGLYRQFGFTDARMPERAMEISNPDLYKKV
jgi:GNAT superfamily N-acetyltransferase